MKSWRRKSWHEPTIIDNEGHTVAQVYSDDAIQLILFAPEMFNTLSLIDTHLTRILNHSALTNVDLVERVSELQTLCRKQLELVKGENR